MTSAGPQLAAGPVRRGLLRRGRTATVMSMRELVRRWPTLVFMIFMPASYFLVSYLTSDPATRIDVELSDGTVVGVLDRDFKALYLAILGISVTSSFAAMTVVRPGMKALRRLRVVGYGAGHLLLARLVLLVLITMVSTAVFLVIFAPLVNIDSLALTTIALVLVGLIGVAFGALVGLLVPGEFEASMLLIALAGIQMALGRGGTDAERYLPYWPGVETLKTAMFHPSPELTFHVALGLGYVAVLLAATSGIWALRTRLYRPAGRRETSVPIS
jgi:hypothetical protein